VKSTRRKFQVTYFVICFGGAQSGVFKKICDQVKEWEDSNLDFQLFVITNVASVNDWETVCKNINVITEKSRKSRFIFRAIQLMKASRQTIETLYIREIAPLPLVRLTHKNSWIIELQTIQENEIKERSTLKALIYKFVVSSWFKNFDGFVCVSEEIKYKLQNTFGKKHSTVISNGIRINDSQILDSTNPNFHPNFFFIGDLTQSWQGVDQIIDFAATMPESQFHLVGPNNLEPPKYPNVFLHGSLRREEYEKIAQVCDVAFGTLNQGSTGMHEASPLKVRECLRWGLPIIGRYRDTDLSEGCEFFLELPNTPAPLSDFKTEILGFALHWKGTRVRPEQLSQMIDSSVKESIRLTFFKQITECSIDS
jgi:hypothetical protein